MAHKFTFAALVVTTVLSAGHMAHAGTILQPAASEKYCLAAAARYPGPLPDTFGIDPNYKKAFQSDIDIYMHEYAKFLVALTAQALVSDDAAKKLKAELLSNAQRKPLKYNEHDAVPPVYHVLLVMVPYTVAYAQHKAEFTKAEQKSIESWVRANINDVKRDHIMLDNKQYQLGVLMAVYGHAANSRQMINAAYSIYKKGIKAQRDDGSLPIDSGRGGSAIHYSNQAVGNLVALAEVLQTAGIDAYGYQSGDKSIHTIIKFLLDATQNPSLIAGYANDPEMRDSSFPGTSPTNQELSWVNGNLAGWGHYYRQKFGGTEQVKRLFKMSPYLRARKVGEPENPYGNELCYIG